MSKVFSREEFYALVWSKPMTHLAKEFFLSDVALHKICRKHDIPKPPVGWWARKAAGKAVSQTALPKATKGIADRITIVGGELRREAESVVAVREQARILASASDAYSALPAQPVVDRTMAKLSKAKPSLVGLVSVEGRELIRCEVAPGSLDRLENILNAIAHAASLQGFELIAGGSAAHFTGSNETIDFTVKETVKRVKHELTPQELAEKEKWRLKSERRRGRNAWDWEFIARPHFPEWDHIPTGQLSFEFENIYVWGGQSPRRSFRDAKIQRLENMASDIAVGLAVLAAIKTEQRLRREAEERQREEERRRRELALRAKHVEERRTSALAGISEELAQLERLRRFVEALRSRSGSGANERVDQFLHWSENHLAKREDALSSAELEKSFENQHLFGPDDDYQFRSPHRY